MSVKIHFLHSYPNYFAENLGDVSVEQNERLIRWREDTRKDGASQW